jgi:hypothetical protein
MAGWIRLHRKLQQSAVWNIDKFSSGQAWVDLILLANHKPGTIKVRGVYVTVQRGQVGYSEVTLAERWQWSRGKVRRFLEWLETEQQIVQQKTNVTSLITIVKYDEYQTSSTADDTASDTADGQQTIQQTDTNKKKEQGEEGKQAGRFVKPTVEEVAAYCRSRGNHVDAETFVAHYESNGWMVGRNHMKSWQGSVRTWEKNTNGHTSPSQAKPQPRVTPSTDEVKRTIQEEFGHVKHPLFRDEPVGP